MKRAEKTYRPAVRKLFLATLAFTGGLVMMSVFGCSGKRPDNLGVRNGKLAPCPSSPNCVCTQSADRRHMINPITYGSSREEARERLEKVIRSMPRTEIIQGRSDYIRAEFTAKRARFVDDVEFYFPTGEKIIHVRSASRVGYWDIGANRKRVELIRRRFADSG